MEFGWINFFGTIMITIMLIPNIIYAVKNKDLENKYNNKLVNIIEQLGRYLSFIFMIFPIGVSGFRKEEYLLFYLIANGILLLFYLILWIFYFKRKSLLKSMFLAILPTMIFFICGITLGHFCLIFSSILFGFAHILITYKNNC